MLTLQLTHTSPDHRSERVDLALHGTAEPISTSVTFSLERTRQDEEDLRWFLEDYLLQPHEPAPALARRIEQRTDAFGALFFRRIFDAHDVVRQMWAAVHPHLGRTRFEIVTADIRGDALPWELLCDAETGEPLALAAQSFVRLRHPASTAAAPLAMSLGPGSLRILVIISRPHGEDDVGFRSVALPMVRSLRPQRPRIDLVVLRPPSFEALGHALGGAQDEGRPFHVVHFDGHGVYDDLAAHFAGHPPKRPRGHLVFEAAGADNAADPRAFISGRLLGRVLRYSGVRLLVLNACRSSHSRPAPTEDPLLEGIDERAHAWGSLAQEVVAAGVAGVVAMRFDIFAATAARFVAGLYASLAEGRSLGEAVTRGRRDLAAAGAPPRLRDWLVPVVYEAEPLILFAADHRPAVGRDGDMKASGLGGFNGLPAHDGELPPAPEVGFCGRDGTLLALDRTFDRHAVVLLHAGVGSGKTATALELARWYTETGGIEGPVLFTSLEPLRPLARVLDQLAPLVTKGEETAVRRWLRWSLADRRTAALELCRRRPPFWIWDDVEPMGHAPSGEREAPDPEGWRELAAFLREAAKTRARFLLTSCRDESSWLGDLAARVHLPPLSPGERLQLARAWLVQRDESSEILSAWDPLLRLTGGHPLTLELVVAQALRMRATTPETAADLAERLQRGALAVGDRAFVESGDTDARARELRALVSLGLERGFTSDERRILSLLVLFRGFVAADVVTGMGDPEAPWGLPGLPSRREVVVELLERAAEAGLLRRLGEGEWGLHPMLPWFLRRLFDEYHGRDEILRRAVERAWVEAMGVRSNTLFEALTRGEVARIRELRAEEANLLEARRLARERGFWHRVTSAMQGLYGLYEHTGRLATWAELVEEIVPDYIDPHTGEPVPGRELRWGLVVGYRVRLARKRDDLAAAERWQERLVEVERLAASEALHKLRTGLRLEREERHALRSLGTSLHELGQIQRAMGHAGCVATYMEAIELAADLVDRAGASACALNLGHAYEDLPEIRDLDQAETWYQRSLTVRPKADFLGRALCLGSLGSVARERFLEAREKGRAAEELAVFLHQAEKYYRQDLEILPADGLSHRAAAHRQLGNTYSDLRQSEEALFHYREAIRCEEVAGNRFGAASVRFNAALHLSDSGRLSDALSYAESALEGFETCGERAAGLVAKTRTLIEDVRGRQGIRDETRGKLKSLLGGLSLMDELPRL